MCVCEIERERKSVCMYEKRLRLWVVLLCTCVLQQNECVRPPFLPSFSSQLPIHSPSSFSLPSHCVSLPPPPFAFFFHCTHSLISFPRQCCLEREAMGDGVPQSLTVCVCISCITFPFASLIPSCNHAPLLLSSSPFLDFIQPPPFVLFCSPLPVILYRPSRTSYFLFFFFLPFPCLPHSLYCAE